MNNVAFQVISRFGTLVPKCLFPEDFVEVILHSEVTSCTWLKFLN